MIVKDCSLNVTNNNSIRKINFRGRNNFNFQPMFDEFSSLSYISDKDILKIFPEKLNIVKDFLKLDGYNIDILSSLKEKRKTEFKYLFDIASRKDIAGTIRIPAEKISDFASLSYEKLKSIEPIVLSKRDIGVWNYEPDYILNLARLDDEKLYTFVELANCNVIPSSTKAILEDNNINWGKVVEKAKALKQLYGKDLREIEFYSNSKGENFFLADIQLPHIDNKPDWQNYKRITVKLDDDVNPISKKKLDTHIEKYVDNIYNKIYKKLQIFTKADLDNVINEVKNRFDDVTEEEILITIKKITQFSSYKSIPLLSEKLQEKGITDLANIGELFKYFDYFHQYKQLFKLSNSENKKYGIIFTKNDIQNLDLMTRLKEIRNKPIFKDVLFINLEGFSEGINLFNDNKKLPDLTVKILKEAKNLKSKNLTFEECVSQVLNNDIERSLKKLGFNVYTLNFNSYSTKKSILEQMSPIMPEKDLIHSTIESIADKYSPEKYTYKKYSRLIAEYYDKNVNIYSKQSIIEDLKLLNKKIIEYIKQNNLSEDNLYVIENMLNIPKSYNIINKMYMDLFNVPDKNILKLKNISEINRLPENSIFLILDDIVGTGNSFVEIGNYDKDAQCLSKNRHILFVPIIATKKGVDFVKNTIHSAARENYDHVIYLEENLLNVSSGTNIFGSFLKKILPQKFYQISDKGYGEQATCIAFPYMSPDNNAYISANLVSLFLPSMDCIKTLPANFKEIQENSIYYNIFGQKKDNIKLDTVNDHVVSWFEKLKDFFLKS